MMRSQHVSTKSSYLCRATVIATVAQLQAECIEGSYAVDLSMSNVTVLKRAFGEVYAVQDGYNRFWYLKKAYLRPLDGGSL